MNEDQSCADESNVRVKAGSSTESEMTMTYREMPRNKTINPDFKIRRNPAII